MKRLDVLFTLVQLTLIGIRGFDLPMKGFRKCGEKNKLCSTCTKDESPCRFEEQYEKSYYGCIEKGQEYFCCPATHSYNNNTKDFTCIGDEEKLMGSDIQEINIDNTDWKFCSNLEYPSCSKVIKTLRNKKIRAHTCTHISQPCNGVCSLGYKIDRKKEICGKYNNFTPSVNFQDCTNWKTDCFCVEDKQPCRFNGYPGKTYDGCINKGSEKHCCPPGFKYNPNSLDVTCIGENEELIQGEEKGNWKWCPDEQYPSCRIKLIPDGSSTSLYKHICRTPTDDCPDEKFYIGGRKINSYIAAEPFYQAYCLRSDSFLTVNRKTGNGWTCINNINPDGPSSNEIRINLVDDNTPTEKENTKKKTNEKNMTTIIGISEKVNAKRKTDKQNMATIIGISAAAGFVLLDTILIISLLCYRRKKRHNVEKVDDNPDYGYGEIYDNIEVTDFNPYYEENEEEYGTTEIVDFNPLYGVGEDEEDGKTEFVDNNSLYGEGEEDDEKLSV